MKTTLAAVLAIVGLTGALLYAQTFPGAQAVINPYTCNQMATATGAANTSVTATLDPPAGQFAYICTIDIAVAANAAVTGAAGPAPIFTTTNLQTNLVWWGTNETLGTGAMRPVIATSFHQTLKTNVADTAFTVVTSAGQSTENVRINVTGYFAP